MADSDFSPEMAERQMFLELAKISETSIATRKSYEWKVNFGFWTAIGAFTYFAVSSQIGLDSRDLVFLAGAYLMAFAVWTACWQFPLHRAHEHDKDWKHYYLHRAEKRGSDNSSPDPYGKAYPVKIMALNLWFLGQTLMTLVFLGISFVVLCASQSQKPSSITTDRISGGNLERVINKLTE